MEQTLTVIIGIVSVWLCSTSRICLRKEATLWKFPFLPGLSWCLLVGLPTCHRKCSPWPAVSTSPSSLRTGCARLAQRCLLVYYVQHSSRRTNDRTVTRKLHLDRQRAALEQACAVADSQESADQLLCSELQTDPSDSQLQASALL